MGSEKKGTTPAPTTRTYNECARRFVTIPLRVSRRSIHPTSFPSRLLRVEIGHCLRIPEDIAKYGPLTEEQMEKRAKVRGLLALVCSMNDDKKRMEFVNRDFTPLSI